MCTSNVKYFTFCGAILEYFSTWPHLLAYHVVLHSCCQHFHSPYILWCIFYTLTNICMHLCGFQHFSGTSIFLPAFMYCLADAVTVAPGWKYITSSVPLKQFSVLNSLSLFCHYSCDTLKRIHCRDECGFGWGCAALLSALSVCSANNHVICWWSAPHYTALVC